jgi:hypothetical protein
MMSISAGPQVPLSQRARVANHKIQREFEMNHRRSDVCYSREE